MQIEKRAYTVVIVNGESLKSGEIRILETLIRCGKQGMQDMQIAECTTLTFGAVTQYMYRLRTKNMIKRHKRDWHQITEFGERVLDAINEV